MTKQVIYECWDNDYTYYVKGSNVILGCYFEDDPQDIAKDAFKAVGFTAIEVGDVSEAIKAAYIAENPDDPEAEDLDNDSDWLEHAIAANPALLTGGSHE